MGGRVVGRRLERAPRRLERLGRSLLGAPPIRRLLLHSVLGELQVANGALDEGASVVLVRPWRENGARARPIEALITTLRRIERRRVAFGRRHGRRAASGTAPFAAALFAFGYGWVACLVALEQAARVRATSHLRTPAPIAARSAVSSASGEGNEAAA
jgi:hypothetical protein